MRAWEGGDQELSLGHAIFGMPDWTTVWDEFCPVGNHREQGSQGAHAGPVGQEHEGVLQGDLSPNQKLTAALVVLIPTFNGEVGPEEKSSSC